jgi:hypothetical protein
MKKLPLVAAAASLACVILAGDEARAQCTTCSPLSLPSSDLVGQDLAAARRSSWAVLAQATAGWVGFPRQLADNERVRSFESARFDLFLTTVQATALHESGLGVEVIAPFGWLASRTGAERTQELSFGDGELRGRWTTLVGRSLRLTGLTGAALPTGNYTVRSGAGALGDSARALTIGRGVTWTLAEVDARAEATRGVAFGVSAQGRLPVGDAPDGFRWGPELRTSGEIELRPFRGPIAVAAGGELQMRGAGSIIDPFLEQRIASENVAATIVSVTPAVRARFESGVFLSLNARIPVFQDLDGLQFQQGAGVFAGVGYVFPVFGRASAKATREAKAGTEAGTSRVAFVVREYGADWCEGCKKLEPLLEATRARRRDVLFERVDVTAWTQEELARRIPGASALPVVEVLLHDGSLVARLEGDHAFTFSNHIPEKTR